jgi:hypothetical protein
MDSTKVEIVNKSLDKLVEKLVEQTVEKPSIWDTLTPLLVGAGLTLFTQFLIELWKSYKEKKLKKQDLISRCRSKSYLIAQLLKTLSMYKVHKQYYLKASQLANDSNKKDDWYKKHYEKGQEQRMTETALSESIAAYCQLVTEYLFLSKKNDPFSSHFQRIFDYVHPKASKFKNCNTLDELILELGIEEKRINEEYLKLRNIIEAIQTSMEKNK